VLGLDLSVTLVPSIHTFKRTASVTNSLFKNYTWSFLYWIWVIQETIWWKATEYETICWSSTSWTFSFNLLSCVTLVCAFVISKEKSFDYLYCGPLQITISSHNTVNSPMSWTQVPINFYRIWLPLSRTESQVTTQLLFCISTLQFFKLFLAQLIILVWNLDGKFFYPFSLHNFSWEWTWPFMYGKEHKALLVAKIILASSLNFWIEFPISSGKSNL
jgi:hypothetical protein